MRNNHSFENGFSRFSHKTFSTLTQCIKQNLYAYTHIYIIVSRSWDCIHTCKHWHVCLGIFLLCFWVGIFLLPFVSEYPHTLSVTAENKNVQPACHTATGHLKLSSWYESKLMFLHHTNYSTSNSAETHETAFLLGQVHKTGNSLQHRNNNDSTMTWN